MLIHEHTSTHAAEDLSAQEAWQLFEGATQREFHMSAEDFIAKYDSGYWPDPDAEPGVTYVQSVREFAQ